MSDVDPRVMLALVGKCPACGYEVGCQCGHCVSAEVPNKIWVRCMLCRRMTIGSKNPSSHVQGNGYSAATYNGTFDGTVFPLNRHSTYAAENELGRKTAESGTTVPPQEEET